MALEDKVRIEWVDPKAAWEEKPGTIYGIWMKDTSYPEIISYLETIPPEHRKRVAVAGWLRPLTAVQLQRLYMLGVGRYDISYGISADDPDVPWKHEVGRRILEFYKRSSRLP